MKGSHWFIIFIVAFLVIMFAVEYHLPKKFVWTPTFGHYDDQPFGCAVFDSLLSASLPNGYTLSKKTFYQLEEEDTLHSRGILAVAHDMALTDIDVKSLLKMAERGNKVMLASTMFSRYLKDTLNFESYRFYFSPLALKKYATSLLAKDSLCWVGDSAVYSPRTFYFYPQLCSSYFWGDSLPGKELARKALHVNEYRYEVEVDSVSTESEQDTLRYVPVAMTCPVGKGEVILVSTPLIFTNYGILDGNNIPLVISNGRVSCCPYRRICQRGGGNAAVSFPLPSFPATASLGVVSDDDCHIAVYDIYGTETATCNTGYPRTGKQIP